MSVQQFFLADPLGVQGLVGCRAVARFFVAPFAIVARLVRVDRTLGQFLALDDRTLTDIGLRRAQIVPIASKTVDRSRVYPWRPER